MTVICYFLAAHLLISLAVLFLSRKLFAPNFAAALGGSTIFGWVLGVVAAALEYGGVLPNTRIWYFYGWAGPAWTVGAIAGAFLPVLVAGSRTGSGGLGGLQ